MLHPRILALAALLLAPAVLGAEPQTVVKNNCPGFEGQGDTCTKSSECAEKNTYATVCTDKKRCAIPCDIAPTPPGLPGCSLGEVCTAGKDHNGDDGAFCENASFRMDLNLLDQCIRTYLEPELPNPTGALEGDAVCSLQANLARLLDQNHDEKFNIYDLDLCVLAFLERPGCEPPAAPLGDGTGCAQDWLTACQPPDPTDPGAEDPCPAGLYCDPETYSCTRDCGLVVPREAGFEAALDRQCMGALQQCDRERGRCVVVDPTELRCAVDSECPAGAYCLVGRCAGECYRPADCPSADWYCTDDNRCRAKPHPEADTGQPTDPKNFVVRFGRSELRLDDVQTSDQSGLFVMDLITKKQVLQNPALSFGYRLELEYEPKRDARCIGLPADCAAYADKAVEDGAQCVPSGCPGKTDAEIVAQCHDWSERCCKTACGADTQCQAACPDGCAGPDCPSEAPTAAQCAQLPVFLDCDILQDAKNAACVTCTGVTKEAATQECKDRVADCTITKDEQWIQLLSPFGTVSAVGTPVLAVDLESSVADALSPGVYGATLRAIYDNGDSDSIRVTYTKRSPSGTYAGGLGLYLGAKENSVTGQRPLLVSMKMWLSNKGSVAWNALLQENGLPGGAPPLDGEAPPADMNFTDVTTGQRVLARLDGNTSLAFTQGGATSTAQNEIPLVGIYTPETNRIRLIGVIDIQSDACILADGTTEGCTASDKLKARNPFGRAIRRQIELFATFDSTVGRLHGIYRETIYGLLPSAFTVEGSFILNQAVADDSPLEEKKLPTVNALPVSFPDKAAQLAELVTDEAVAACAIPDDASEDEKKWYNAAAFRFLSKGSFNAYIKAARRKGGTAGSPDVGPTGPLGRTTIFPQLLQFDEILTSALAALGTEDLDANAAQNHLNVYDFLSSRIQPCGGLDPNPVCVDRKAVECGLAHHQRAWLEEWFTPGQVGAFDGGNILFCPDTLPLAGCPASADLNQDGTFSDPEIALFAMQEHNRFWRNLGQILKFGADKARSDAFMVLLRNEVNPFAVGGALAYKREQLRLALQDYDALVRTFVGTVPAQILWSWPAEAFQANGRDWLDLLQTIAEDRMGVLAELVDLERRILLGAGTDFMYAQHLMQYEYLVQLYLMKVEQEWQKEGFAYAGQAARVLDAGQGVVNQLDQNKNAIGVTGGLVYFESAKPEVDNWVAYRDRLVGPGGTEGLLADAKDTTANAVANLQGSLTDLDALESSLLDFRQTMEDDLVGLCGVCSVAQTAADKAKYNCVNPCEKLYQKYKDATGVGAGYDATQSYSKQLWYGKMIAMVKNVTSGVDLLKDIDGLGGVFGGTPAGEGDKLDVVGCKKDVDDKTHSADGEECFDVSVGFKSSLITPGATGEPADASECVLDTDKQWIEQGGEQRDCMGGEVGELLQERRHLLEVLVGGRVRDLELAWDDLTVKLHLLKTKDAYNDSYVVATTAVNAVHLLLSYIKAQALAMKEGVDALKNPLDSVNAFGFTVAFGMAFKILRGALEAPSKPWLEYIAQIVEQVGEELHFILDTLGNQLDFQSGQSDLLADIRSSLIGLDGAVGDAGILMHEIFNITAQIEDRRQQAQFAADQYNKQVTFAASHLLGRETGLVLRGDALVADSATALRGLVDVAYRMVMAFSHAYNLSAGQHAALVNQVLRIVTLDDVADLVAMLDDMAADYCGLEGFDCDASSNVNVLRYSVREQLFPQLRDIVGQDGVVTAGEQFHNLILQPPYLKRRIRGVYPADQIELNLKLPVTVLESTANGTPQWLLNPLTCNHLLDPNDPAQGPDLSGVTGTVAVNIQGQNLGDGAKTVYYELVRGPSDFIRSCHAESSIVEPGTGPVLEYPIRRYTVGYAPQSLQALLPSPTAYSTTSTELAACINQTENAANLEGAGCWRFFARGRSLASLDWRLVIPLLVDGADVGNNWVAGDGLKASERPIITDIVVYFRYRSRPISDP